MKVDNVNGVVPFSANMSVHFSISCIRYESRCFS